MYRRLTRSLDAVGTLIPANENPYKYVSNQNEDWYLSVYKYSEDQKKQAEEIIEVEKDGKKFSRPRGVKGITDVKCNVIVFDTDKEDNPEKARKDAIEIVNRLEKLGYSEDNIAISFSGNKGFGIEVYIEDNLTPKEHKNIAKHIAGDLVYSKRNNPDGTMDTTLYNASRIFRLDFTKHMTSGLYKTPLTKKQLETLSVDEIKDIAKEPKYPHQRALKSKKLPKELLEAKSRVKEVEKKKNKPLFSLDFTKKPYYLTDVKYALHKGYIPEGHGNTGMMILCATYKHVGFDKTDAYHMLKGVNEKRSEIYGIEKRSNDQIWHEVVQYVYSPNWNGGTYGDETDLIQETCETFGIVEKTAMVSISDVKDRFIKFSKNINKNVIRTGIKSLDDSVLMTTGMMVGLLAAPSSGKTSVATKIIESLSSNGQNVLFLSLDMHDTLLYSRLLQRVSGENVEGRLRSMIETDPTYNDEYSIEEDEAILKAFDKVEDLYGNVNFDFTRGCTIESVEENIKANKAKFGDNLKMVVVDYLEKVRGPYSDATANSGYVASRLSDLASTYDVAILLLLQPQKSAGDPSEELLSMRKVKGASVIEQDCRVIMTLWRPGFNPQMSANDKYASIAVVKNNMGPVTQIDFGWNGLKGEVTELSRSERDALDALREEIKEQKKEDKQNDW